MIRKIVPKFIRKRISSAIQPMIELNEMKRLKMFLKMYLKDCNHIFDIGANVGDFSKVYLSLGCKIVCVEPQESLVKKLKLKFKNNLNIVVENKGVSYKKDKLKLYYDDYKMAQSSFNKNWIKSNGLKYTTVDVVTLDYLIEKYGLPDYIKIDVEGYEYNVIKGLSYKIKNLSFEFHNKVFKNTLDCIRLLNSLKYNKFNLSEASNHKFVFNKFINAQKLICYLKSKDVDYHGDIYCK